MSLADKGISNMACRSRTSAETEQIREREEALSATENTRQLDELLCLSKGVTRAPADNFWELKINTAMFMPLVWVLFGSNCNYYKGLHNVYATLELKEVMAQKNSFTPEHCCRVTWAILDDGHVHFDDVKTTLDFQGPDDPTFPQSYLIDILRNVQYTIPVERANFPNKWKRKNTPPMGDPGAKGPVYRLGQQQGGDRSSQGMGQGVTTPKRDYGHAQGYGGGGYQSQQGQDPHQGGWWWNPPPGGQYQGVIAYHGGGAPLSGQFPPGGYVPRDWQTGWKDERHPKIKSMMQK